MRIEKRQNSETIGARAISEKFFAFTKAPLRHLSLANVKFTDPNVLSCISANEKLLVGL